MNNPLLAIGRLNKSFDGLAVLDSLFLNVQKGTIKTLIGPNGAGKTTLLDIICGLEKADSGKIVFRDVDITGRSPEAVAGLGISRTFQTSQVFERINVIENIMLGRYLNTKVGFFKAGIWLRRCYWEEHRNMQSAFDVLEFLGLYEKADRKISQVSYMERRLIELGRAIAMEPELLLLDEPFGGLTAREGQEVAEKIIKLKERGITLIIIDHHFGIVSEISDEIAVLHNGSIIAKGSPEEIKNNQAVKVAYFFHGNS
jgi:ABC-type branched-subunit amino acid transport system ATPase component